MIITIIRDFLDFSFRVVYIYDCVRFWTQCAVLAQSVARRLGKAEVGGSSPLGSLMKIACRQRVLNILWRHAVFVKTEIFACLYKKKKPGYHRRLKKGGKVYMKKLFALYAYNIGEKCE